jgi:hypothetical protein
MRKSTIILGPLSETLLAGARSAGHDEYPAHQEWADELEKLLAFAVSQNQFDRFANPISKGRAHQRDEALAELRAAFFLSRSGFPIIKWDPPGASGTVGEFLLDAKGQPVFVEVKSPGWEAELSADEIKAGRTKQPKYVHGDARAVAPWLQVRQCIKRAYHKFTDDQSNLLLIADDFHVSLVDDLELVKVGLFETRTVFGGEPGSFTNAAYERLGGVALFGAHLMGDKIEYSLVVLTNPFALKETRLQESLTNLKTEDACLK